MVLQADDEVIGITHNDHVASGDVPSLARGPEVEGLVRVDVGTLETCRLHRAMSGFEGKLEDICSR
jgi:hypothetical protein